MLTAMRVGSDVPASERVRERIAEWVERHGHGAQRLLLTNIAKYCDETRKDQWLSDILNKRSKIVLDDVDLVAVAIDTPPGNLIRQRDRNYHELTMAETKLVEWFRSLTSDGRRHFWAWIESLVAQTYKGVAQSYVAGVKLPKVAHRGGTHTYGDGDQGTATLDLSDSLAVSTIDANVDSHIAALGRLNELRARALTPAPGDRPSGETDVVPHDRTTAHHAPPRRRLKKSFRG
jgi:hypothetical protein